MLDSLKKGATPSKAKPPTKIESSRILITEEDEAKLIRLSKQYGMTTSQYLRHIIKGAR